MRVRFPDGDVDHADQLKDIMADAREDRAEIKRLRDALSALTWHPAVQRELRGTAMLSRAEVLTAKR